MAYLKHAEAFLAKLPSISMEGMDQLGVQSSVKLQMAPCETQGHKGPPGCQSFAGSFQPVGEEQNFTTAPLSGSFSPDSTLLHLPSLDSYDSAQVSKAGLKKSQLNVLSSCEETDAMEDLSPLRSGGRKKKHPAEGKRKVGRPIAYCGDPDSPDLLPAERRRIKRRIANRESARRVRARRQGDIEEMSHRARQIEDQNRQLAGHADRVEQQQAEMALQLRELTKRLQQTTTENEQLSEEVRSLRNAVKAPTASAATSRGAKGCGAHSATPPSKAPAIFSSNAMDFKSRATEMPYNTEGLQSAGSFGNGLCSAFAQSASAALDLRAEPSGLLPDIPRGFSQGFALAPSIDPLMPNLDSLGMPLCDFMLGEAC